MNQIATIEKTRSLLLRPCPLCGGDDSKSVFDTIRKCEQCGLAFVNPLANYHGENESEDYFHNEYLPLHRSNWDNSFAERRAHLQLIRCRYPLPASPRLLDVGCALGFMLREAKAAGFDALGVETSEFGASYAAEHTNCPVHKGTLQDAAFQAESFDVVTLMDVIEHVPQPCDLMDEVYRVLRPGGVVFLITPNFGSFFVHLYGAKAYGIGPEEHATYLQPSTMKKLLQKSGFRNIAVGTKDFYAENLRRLMRRNCNGSQSQIKAAFGTRRSLGTIRRIANRVLMHVPIGDKLIALAQK